jgi:hypothetical protein
MEEEKTARRKPPVTKYEETPDDLYIVEKTYTEAEEELIKFVEKKIAQMNESLLFNGDSSPSFSKLNQSLMEYESVMLGLLVLHQEARFKASVAQENYDNFYSVKYVDIKAREASLDPKKKIPAAKEIEMAVRKEYMVELAKLKAKVMEAENEYNFINHLVESWKNYQFVLGTLSRNAQAEASASGVSYKNPYEND